MTFKGLFLRNHGKEKKVSANNQDQKQDFTVKDRDED